MNKIKHVKGVCCLNPCLSVPPVSNVPNAEFLASLADNWCKSSGGVCPERGLHPTIQTETPIDKVPSGSKWLRQSSKEPVLKRSLTQSHGQVGSGKGRYQVVPGILQPAFPCPQTKQKMETNLGPESVELIPEYQDLQDGNSGDNPVIITDRGMGNIAGLQRRVFPHSNKAKVTKISEVFPVQLNLPIHSSSLWSGYSSSRVYQGGQGSETYGSSKGYQDPPVPRRLVADTCLQHTQTLLALCQQLGWVVNMKKSELIPQQVFNFVGYRFDLVTGRVLPTPDRWTTLQEKLKFIKNQKNCTVRQFMSLIGLLTATEKQVWSGRLHMRPIQWHLQRHWHVPEVLEVILVPQSLHPHLDWWSEESNVLRGQPLHPLQHALQLFTDASNEGWGAHLGDSTAIGVWSVIESRLHINFLELKAVFLALKSFEHLCRDQIVLVATDNTTVVSYINKQGGMKSGSLCALLWRLLSWCHPRGIVLRARHIPGRLNVIADKLSRHNQVIQTEWSLSQQVFNHLCSIWGRPQTDLFATRFNHKLPQFVSPVPDPAAWVVDALSLPWESLDVYAFPPISLIPQVIAKMMDQGCRRMILIAPGWPNIPWFWDLVNLSVQIPLSLSLVKDLVTQPFNGLVHRNLSNLNLHAWLLESLPSRNKGSLMKWQKELRLLRGAQPEPCTSQSGPFLLNGASYTRWTSGRPL